MKATRQIGTAYDVLERRIGAGPWAIGEDFSLADCAALPALYYANRLVPFEARHAQLSAYLERLKARPSVARVLEEAAPFLAMFPG